MRGTFNLRTVVVNVLFGLLCFYVGITVQGRVLAADAVPVLALEYQGISIALGMTKEQAIADLGEQFIVGPTEPDHMRPELSFYQVFKSEGDDTSTYHGSLVIKDGKVTKASRRMGKYKGVSTERFLVDLIKALETTSLRYESRPQTYWVPGNSRKYGGRGGNRELGFNFGKEAISVEYFDHSPRASQDVVLTHTIG
jgi:hypothetical protein